jgi:predicted DNA-binding transcriptional regulator AlpA
MRKKAAADPPSPPPSSAAEEDARNMLLAGGLKPEPDISAVQQLLNDLGSIDSALFTIEEFCQFVRISKATFYRIQKDGAGPTMTLIGSAMRIRKQHALDWVAAQPVLYEQQTPKVEQEPRALPPRRLRLPKPEGEAKKRKSHTLPPGVPGLFDPPPKKRGRTRRVAVVANGNEEGDEA